MQEGGRREKGPATSHWRLVGGGKRGAGPFPLSTTGRGFWEEERKKEGGKKKKKENNG